MNPYETPVQPANHPPATVQTGGGIQPTGKPCPHCGSRNTGKDTISHSTPNIFFVIFLGGWIFLLIRTAFSKQVDQCRDCGETNAYRSTSSKLAIIALVVMAALIALAALEPSA